MAHSIEPWGNVKKYEVKALTLYASEHTEESGFPADYIKREGAKPNALYPSRAVITFSIQTSMMVLSIPQAIVGFLSAILH
ncbi:MAG: hypothetical protein IGR76_07620 [Synechococcales cyanobacterium T60_A2020_003]|nr:hypothetical protein [Synechococcales cyanobacterium T60_A2020_003]